jgi:hypothetical protein
MIKSTISGKDIPCLMAIEENFRILFNLQLAVVPARHFNILKSHFSGKRRTESYQNERAGLKSTHCAVFKSACRQSR